jgi:hypothetical protein
MHELRLGDYQQDNTSFHIWIGDTRRRNNKALKVNSGISYIHVKKADLEFPRVNFVSTWQYTWS